MSITATRKSKTVVRYAAAVIAVSSLMVGCGGGDVDSIDSVDPTPPIVNETTISAEPAFLSRSCDGLDSPHLFCPNVNGV